MQMNFQSAVLSERTTAWPVRRLSRQPGFAIQKNRSGFAANALVKARRDAVATGYRENAAWFALALSSLALLAICLAAG